MKEEVARVSLAIVLSALFTPAVLFLLSYLWSALFPTLGIGSFVVKQSTLISYTWKQNTPVVPAVAIGTAILFYLFLNYLEREEIADPSSPLTLLVLLALVFVAYYFGLAGFTFFNLTSTSLHYRNFFYFLYVPYWPSIAGLLAAWVARVIPLPKSFKEEARKSSR